MRGLKGLEVGSLSLMAPVVAGILYVMVGGGSGHSSWQCYLNKCVLL